jgi:hypothetical protein
VQAAIEAFDEGVRGRFSGRDIVPVKLAVIHELQDWVRGEFGLDLHRFCSGQVLMLSGPLFEGHG